MQCVEFRCELRDPTLAKALLKRLGAIPVGEAAITDTYYRLPDGYLKKREAPDEPTDWVFYHRKERAAPNIVKFSIYADAEAQLRFAGDKQEPWCQVHKKRQTWLLEHLNIHTDHVEIPADAASGREEAEVLGRFLKVDALVTRRHNLFQTRERLGECRHALWPALGEPLGIGYGILAARTLGLVPNAA